MNEFFSLFLLFSCFDASYLKPLLELVCPLLSQSLNPECKLVYQSKNALQNTNLFTE